MKFLKNPSIDIVHHRVSICPVFCCQHIAEVVDFAVFNLAEQEAAAAGTDKKLEMVGETTVA